ncbi:MAG: zinc ribbon domain-containing protein [Thermoplasmata archaeon]
MVLYVNPKHTSRRCLRCGYVNKNNRHGSAFRCKNCVFELNADLNASRNIEVFFIYEYFSQLSRVDRCGLMNVYSWERKGQRKVSKI